MALDSTEEKTGLFIWRNHLLKKCNKCGIHKDTDWFSKDNSRPDKLQSWCKACRSDYCKQPKYKELKRSYRKSDKGKEACKRSYENNKNASLSTRKFNNQIQSGGIAKEGLCSKCYSKYHIEAHHCDYDRPYDVMWLCKSCHVEWHKNNQPKNAKYGKFNKQEK